MVRRLFQGSWVMQNKLEELSESSTLQINGAQKNNPLTFVLLPTFYSQIPYQLDKAQKSTWNIKNLILFFGEKNWLLNHARHLFQWFAKLTTCSNKRFQPLVWSQRRAQKNNRHLNPTWTSQTRSKSLPILADTFAAFEKLYIRQQKLSFSNEFSKVDQKLEDWPMTITTYQTSYLKYILQYTTYIHGKINIECTT